MVCDYVDVSTPQLERSYKRRLKVYASLGYEVAGSFEERENSRGSFIDASAWTELFIKDAEPAGRSVEVFAPHADMKCMQILVPAFKQAASRGIRVVCYLCDRTSRNRRHACGSFRSAGILEKAGCSVVPVRGIRSGFAVFDEKIVWYGDLLLLGQPGPDACDIRIDSAEVAHDLMQDARKLSRVTGRSDSC